MTDKPTAPSTYDFETVLSSYDQDAGHKSYRGTHVEISDYDELSDAFDAVETERDEALHRVEQLEEDVKELEGKVDGLQSDLDGASDGGD